VKAFMDGTLGSGTAWMLDGSGEQLLSEDILAEAVVEAAQGGLGIAVHAIGDGANRAVLNALERTRGTWEDALVRPRVEHAQCLDPADVPRFGRLGLIASMQPAMIASDREVADARWGERAMQAFRVRDLLDAGAHVVFGSDAPIEALDPLAAVHRTLDDREPWHGDQRIAVADAILAHTAAAAYAMGDERWRGCLLPGYAADLLVLDTDIVRHPERIREAQVVATMLAGRWVHGAPPW
jgi:predicted amidohydrolase YtcJ